MADDHPLLVGSHVTVGHGAVIHACTIEDECLIGMNATILDGAHIGKQSIVAAGSLVPAGTHIPDGSLFAGVPGGVEEDAQRKTTLFTYRLGKKVPRSFKSSPIVRVGSLIGK